MAQFVLYHFRARRNCVPFDFKLDNFVYIFAALLIESQTKTFEILGSIFSSSDMSGVLFSVSHK